MKKTHDPGANRVDFDGYELRRKFELFEMSLAGLVQGFFTTTKDVDAILEEANS